MLAEPLSPLLYVLVSPVFFEVDLVADLLGVPHQQVVVHLHAFRVQHQVAQPVWQEPGRVHLVEELVVVGTLGLQVLEEHHLEEVGLQEDVYNPRTHLHDRQVEEEGRP